MIFTESEVKSSKFVIGLSVRIRGRRKITNPVKIKATDLTKQEFNFLNSLILKYNKQKSRKQA
jgi:hypothetical protein